MDTKCQSNNESKHLDYYLSRFLNRKRGSVKSHLFVLCFFLWLLYQTKIYYYYYTLLSPPALSDSSLKNYNNNNNNNSYNYHFSILLFLLLLTIYVARWIDKTCTITHQPNEGERHTCFKDEIESKNHHDSIYCFSVYHHQRWLFPTGWNDLTHDRPAWSDVHLEETPRIEEFQLPPPMVLTYQQNKKIVEWSWLDPHWFVSTAGIDQYDGQGWQYGNTRWQKWTGHPYGLGIFTRRRLWIRRAQRAERWLSTESVFSEDLFSDWESTSSLSDKSTL